MEGFEIKCLKCGSKDVEIEEDIDWAYDGEEEYPVCVGCSIKCNNCGNSKEVEEL